jgi:hypothetical protein
MFGRMNVVAVLDLQTAADEVASSCSDAAVARLLDLTDHPKIERWVQFPKAVFVFLTVPGDPESGAFYVYERRSQVWFWVDFDDDKFGGYTTADFDRLVRECGFLDLVELCLIKTSRLQYEEHSGQRFLDCRLDSDGSPEGEKFKVVRPNQGDQRGTRLPGKSQASAASLHWNYAVRRGGARNESCCRLQTDSRPGAPLGCLSPAPDASDPRGTSRQSNTHSTELREVLYPWHPWYGRSVWIHATFVKSGGVVCRCSLAQNDETRLFEIPQWMFEAGACCLARRAEKPAVDCAALLDLKILLHRVRSPVTELVVQAQHSPPGDADARFGDSTESTANRIVSPSATSSDLAKVTARNQTEDRRTTCAVARTQPKNPHRPPRKGEMG